MTITAERGGVGEENGFSIWLNAFVTYEHSWDPHPCRHASEVRTETLSYGEQVKGYRVPRVVVSYNQGGHDCTGVCCDCIAEALAAKT